MRHRRLAIAPTLAAVGVLAVAGLAGAHSDRSGDPLFAVLDGGYEISPEGKAGAGDPDGFGSATVLVAGPRKLCYGLTVAGVDKPVAAHIHVGRPGVNGPVVVPLTQPATGAAGASSGCVRVDRALVKAIHAHPKDYYVNIHTEAFPGGAVRGQLH